MEIVEGDVAAQTEQVLANLQAVLTEAGVTWNDVVKTTCFLCTMDDFAAFNGVYSRVLGDARPARSTVCRLPSRTCSSPPTCPRRVVRKFSRAG
jgi:2-iminobutanoate/2-iminopropanoate deaminase